MAVKRLSDLSEGSIVKLNESSVPVEFYVAKHNYESDLNGNGRTLLVRKECHSTRAWGSYKLLTYASSSVNTWLNNTYKNLLDADIKSVLTTTKFYYTPATTSSGTNVDVLSRSVFLLSVTEFGKSAPYNKSNKEGSALPISSLLVPAYLDGSAVDQWTRSPNTSFSEATIIRIGSNGVVGFNEASNKQGVRPAFTLPETLYVLEDGTVTLNNSPVISSETNSGVDIGIQNDGFNFSYSVSDVEGDLVTVNEYLDGVLKRTFEAVLGETYTFECTTPDNYQKVLNGVHTLSVIASDGKADSDSYTITFTKKVTSASIAPVNPFPADSEIQVVIAMIVGSLPDDVNITVEMTNNANDDNPVWEDATDAVLRGVNHVFSNHTAVNGFAFNFRLSVSRGDSDVGGYINNIGGAFQ